MARATFGGGAADFVFQAVGGGLLRLAPATLTFWSAKTGGTKHTDLLLNGSPVSSITVGSDGQIPEFQGPDGVFKVWADAGAGRVELTAGSDDPAVGAMLSNPASTSAGAVLGLLRPRGALNILDFGVTTGTTSSQTTTIKAALDANPGKTFYFPPGDYRLDSTLAVTANNSLVLAPDARIYAGAAMGTLVDYDNGLTVSNFTQDKAIVGGLLDAALLANKALAIGSVIRFSLANLTIKDPINRGIWLKPAGAEVVANDIRIFNSGTTNVADNWAIEADMGDCQLSNVITRDFTNGVWDKGGNVWNDVHPWIGTTTQLTARYPGSIGFLADSDCIFTRPYADTYQTSFKTQASSGFRKVRIIDPRIFANTGNLTSGLASANPGVCYNLTDGAQVYVRGANYTGASTAHALVTGSTIRFNHRDWIDRVPGSVTGLAEYKRGVQMGTTAFAASVFGSTSGTATLTTNSCTVEVRDGTSTYRFLLVGTIPATGWAGKLRIGLQGFPSGATNQNTGVGTLSYLSSSVSPATFANVTACFSGGLASPGTTIVQLNTVGTGSAVEPDTAAIAGSSIQIWGQLTAPFTYPS